MSPQDDEYIEQRKLMIQRRQKLVEIESCEAELHRIKTKRVPEHGDDLDIILLEQRLIWCRQDLSSLDQDIKKSTSQSSSTTTSTADSGSSFGSFGWSEVSVPERRTAGKTGRRVHFKLPPEVRHYSSE